MPSQIRGCHMHDQPAAISGVEAMRGVGTSEARGFWADAWLRVLRNRSAIFAIGWIGLVALGAIFAPILANSNPLWLGKVGPNGEITSWTLPLWNSLTATDLLLLFGSIAATIFIVLPIKMPRGERLGVLAVIAVFWMLSVVLVTLAAHWLDEPSRVGVFGKLGKWISDPQFVFRRIILVAAMALPIGLAFLVIPFLIAVRGRIIVIAIALAAVAFAAGSRWQARPVEFDRYVIDEAAGRI
ncbi:MAG: hypothetical protein O2875_06655, partial [Planctomycetota bacterium]|nr:hypothetical protein [Planctomycetota bacterium]